MLPQSSAQRHDGAAARLAHRDHRRRHPVRPGQQFDARGGGAAGGEAGLLDDYQAQAAIQTQELEEERNTALKSIIEQEFAAYIVDKAAQMGAACTAQITCRLGEDGVFLPQSAAVQGSFTPQQQEDLARILEEELAIPRARQSFLTKEEEESP